MRTAGLTTSRPGHVRDSIRRWDFEQIGNQSVLITMEGVDDDAQDRFYQVYVGGIPLAPLVYYPPDQTGPIYAARMYSAGARGTVAIEDFGGWAYNPYFKDAYTWVNENEEDVSKTIRFTWYAPTTFSMAAKTISASGQDGDTSITALSLTGLKRFSSVKNYGHAYRGRLYYTLTQSGGTTTLKLYAADSSTYDDALNLVASGTYVGSSGTMTLAGSGRFADISGSATFAYTSDKADTFEVMWPEQYQIHYSTSSLTFPRTPEATVSMEGTDSFYYKTSSLSAGTYYAAVVPVILGVPQSASVTVTSGLVLDALPIAPTITSVTGSAAALTVNWTNGETGDTYKVYASKINEPVNYGSFATPAVITTALNATSQALAAVTGYPGKVRVCVQAVRSGVELKSGVEYEVELDASGVIVGARPNPGIVGGSSSAGLDLTVFAYQETENQVAAATDVDLFCEPVGTPFSTVRATATLSSADVYKYATLTYTVPASGWYHLTIKPKTAGGVYADTYTEVIEYLTSSAPSGLSGTLITTGN